MVTGVYLNVEAAKNVNDYWEVWSDIWSALLSKIMAPSETTMISSYYLYLAKASYFLRLALRDFSSSDEAVDWFTFEYCS